MKYIILVLLVIMSLKLNAYERYVVDCRVDLLKASLDSAIAQIGTIEKTGKNDGDVCKYLASVGLKSGNPYCAAGVYWCFVTSANDLGLSLMDIPVYRTGLANKMFNEVKAKARRTRYEAEINDLIVWRKRASFKGHIERIVETSKVGWVKTVAFNVKGMINDKNVEGVFFKKRNVYHPIWNMNVRGLIGFEGKE